MDIKKEKTRGFTLAEILLVIAIIGVVSAMTLSPFRQSISKRQFVTKVKKSYSILRQVTVAMQQKNTSIESLDLDEFFEEFKSNFSQAKICDSLSDCFGTEYKRQGSAVACNTGLYLNESRCKSLKTADGISYAVCYASPWTRYLRDFDVQVIGYGSTDGGIAYFYFVVDVTGKQKPNVGGHDYFSFVYLPKYGVIPDGTGTANSGHYDCQGYAANVLKTGKLADE